MTLTKRLREGGCGNLSMLCIKLGLAENAMNDALRDAGLLTTAPQETQP